MVSSLPTLEALDLRNNKIINLQKDVANLKISFRGVYENFNIFNGIKLFGNPLTSPPVEIIKQGRGAIRSYFQSLSEEHPLNEARILFVGDGSVGKTSLVKRILNQTFDLHESQTHGINIRKKQFNEGGCEILAHFWDFGGQEIMHATHQFFLSKRSLYILVLDGRKDEKADYWLRAIESFGGNSPVLVVLNKIDENPGFDVNRRHLQRKYPDIRGFFRISCRDEIGLLEFRTALQETLNDIEVLNTLWPKSWFNIKQSLEQMNASFIDYGQYTDICAKNAVPATEIQDTLVRFLRDLGIVVHFPDFDLQDVYVLDPLWVTEGVYKILNSPHLAETGGVLDLHQLHHILTPHAQYPRDKHRYLVDLMKKFELCHTINDNVVLVPDLLEVQEPEIDIDFGDSLQFRIDYRDFLPRSIMPRFLVKMHQDVHRCLRWRSGVVLHNATFQSTAVVRCDYAASQINIQVTGARRRDYFVALLFFFREIHDNFEKLRYDERVPLRDNPDVAPPYQHLLNLLDRGDKEFLPEGMNQAYDVRELLGTVQEEKGSEKQSLELLREIQKTIEVNDPLDPKKLFELKPSVMGVGVNLNHLLEHWNLNGVLQWIKGLVRR